jgi:hypothetical protein
LCPKNYTRYRHMLTVAQHILYSLTQDCNQNGTPAPSASCIPKARGSKADSDEHSTHLTIWNVLSWVPNRQDAALFSSIVARIKLNLEIAGQAGSFPHPSSNVFLLLLRCLKNSIAREHHMLIRSGQPRNDQCDLCTTLPLLSMHT